MHRASDGDELQRTLERALQQHFGFASFRGAQEQVVRHVLAGGDALVVMATGEGKSLCYQLPALLLDGLTLVVSPLIALMEDQVAALRRRGLPANCVHSLLTAEQRRARIRAALAGELKLLYVTPERFRVGDFQDVLPRLRVSLLAVDEAHCVSQWGHDFRPDYSRLGLVREALRTTSPGAHGSGPPCLALTATATPAVQQDILSVLRMPDARVFHTGIERPNLWLGVQEPAAEEDKLPHLARLLQDAGGPGIVYFALIRDLLRQEDELRRRGLRPLVYHGDLSASERGEQQSRFLDSRDAVILATNAFGMGVDKPDIRFIVHWQVPRTLEQYYQEIGRAGRDGKGSVCELLYLEDDVSIQREFTEWANPSADFLRQVADFLGSQGERLQAMDVQSLRETFLVKNRRDGRVETCLRLLRAAGCIEGELGRDLVWRRPPTDAEIAEWLPDDKRQRDLMGLLHMVRYARATTCRKREVHAYFGFTDFAADGIEGGCGSCDRCAELEAWLSRMLPLAERRPIVLQAPGAGSDRAGAAGEGGDERLERGDWIEVRGVGLCAVQRVHREGRRLRVDVEVAQDLTRRTFDLRRVQWRKV